MKSLAKMTAQLFALLTLCAATGWIFSPAPSFASQSASPEESINSAANDYRDGRYADAARTYQSLIDSGLENGHLYYNLANAHFRLKQYGKAIAAYRKALLFLPGDADVLANLSLARREVVDSIGGSSEQTQSEAPFIRLNDSQLKLALIIVYTAFFLCLALQPFVGPVQGRIINRIQTGSLIFAVLLGAIVFGTRQGRLGERVIALTPAAHAVTPAVVVREKVEVRSGDGESFQVVFVLHDGAEIEVGEQRGSWLEVLLPEGRRGWLPADSVSQIALGKDSSGAQRITT